MERVNSATLLIGDPTQPGVQNILHRLRQTQKSYTPAQLVDAALTQAGAIEVSETTRQELTAHAAAQGDLRPDQPCAQTRLAELLQLIVSTREYQLA